MPKLQRVLLVDDDPVANYINERLVKKFNVDYIITKLNGAEALMYLKGIEEKDFPQLILLDINMPVMDGFEFYNNLLKLKGKDNLHVFFLSSSSYISDIQKVKENNCGLLIKPLTEDVLRGIIEHYF